MSRSRQSGESWQIVDTVTISSVRFEHHYTPALGIGESRPRISWAFEGNEYGWMQSAYELNITRADGSSENYRVSSPGSQLVPWPSRPLSSRERATVRVRATDCYGAVTEWSSPTHVEAGLLDANEWTCALIRPAGKYQNALPHRPVTFHRKFNLNKPVTTARLYITSHGIHYPRINGKAVGDHVLAPGWTCYKDRLIYETFDVTTLLRTQNDISVDVGEGWFCGRLGMGGGRSNIYGDRIGLIAMLNVQHADGEEITIGTDHDWMWSYNAIQSSEIYDGEVFDARLQTADMAQDIIQQGPLRDHLVAPQGPPIRRIMTIKPQDILRSPSGKTVIDMGQNMVGWLKVVVKGSVGTKITFQFAEVFENGEISLRSLRGAKCRDTLILSEVPVEWEPKFTFRGFRYVEVTGWPGELSVDDVAGIVVHSDMRRLGNFVCSNSLLNRLHENVVWSLRGNFLGIPTDCPQRDERLGYTGDMNVFCDTANLLFDTTGMLSSWLEDLKIEQDAANDIVPLTIPNVINGFADFAHAIWGDAAVMVPWSLYNATGDLAILARQYSSMKKWLKAIPRMPNGLWNYISGWKLGDWLDPAAPADNASAATTDPTWVSDAFLVYVSKIVGRISALLGEADASHLAKAAADLKATFAHQYITPAGLLSADTQTFFALAIHFSLFSTDQQQQQAAARLAMLVSEKHQFHIATGFAGTPYIGHALTQVNRSDLFYRMLLNKEKPSWLYPVTMGATTIWERWDSMLPDGRVNPNDMVSFNHYALGSVASWMYNTILGLKALEPGWRVFSIQPIPGGDLQWADGSFLTPFGLASVRWEIRQRGDDEVFWIAVRIPPATKARVKLPGDSEAETVGSGMYEWERAYTA